VRMRALLGFELRASHLVHYGLSHTFKLFSSDYFGDRVLVFAQASLNHHSPVLHF
jgi:hypothetical protein